MAAPSFTASGDQIMDRFGIVWTIEQAEARLHLIADLLADPLETDGCAKIGVTRIAALAAAIRSAKRHPKAAQSPYEQGAAAFRGGQPQTSNPHAAGSVAALSWFNGWRRAEWEDAQ